MKADAIPAYKLPPLQEPRELEAFIEILKAEGARSYLEIGSMHGASLWRIANALPKGSRIVSVDMMCDRPDAVDSLSDCIRALWMSGYEAHSIIGDSTDPENIKMVRELGPFDALFIDGNHSPDYVLADWTNYGPMARIVAFHDINWNDSWVSARGNTPDASLMGAPKIWDIVKKDRRTKEFKFYPPQNYYGIGVLWNDT